jgi:hypothetical protein
LSRPALGCGAGQRVDVAGQVRAERGEIAAAPLFEGARGVFDTLADPAQSLSQSGEFGAFGAGETVDVGGERVRAFGGATQRGVGALADGAHGGVR